MDKHEDGIGGGIIQPAYLLSEKEFNGVLDEYLLGYGVSAESVMAMTKRQRDIMQTVKAAMQRITE